MNQDEIKQHIKELDRLNNEIKIAERILNSSEEYKKLFFHQLGMSQSEAKFFLESEIRKDRLRMDEMIRLLADNYE